MVYSKISAVILSIIIIGLIIATGPTQAVKLGIDITDNKVPRGTNLNIMPKLEIVSPEIVDIDYVLFKLSGVEDIECKFYPNATPISGCDGIKISFLDIESQSVFGYGYGLKYKPLEKFGYGYGYKPGFLKYKLDIETEFFQEGDYKTSLTTVSGEKTFSENGETITIELGPTLGKVCSIRASNGEGTVNNISFNKNRINFYTPVNNKAIQGEGYLTGQKGRDRFMYRFNIIGIIANNSNFIKFHASGKYRIGSTAKYINENSIITFDKTKKVISINGEKIKVSNMNINFRREC